MPRIPSLSLRHTSRRVGRRTPWRRTASIAPPRPRDLEVRHLSLPRSSWTPAEVLVSLLEEGHGEDWGEEGPDIRPNIGGRRQGAFRNHSPESRYAFSDIEQPQNDQGSFSEDLPFYALTLTVEPAMFIRPVTVTVVLDSYVAGNIEAPARPSLAQDGLPFRTPADVVCASIPVSPQVHPFSPLYPSVP